MGGFARKLLLPSAVNNLGKITADEGRGNSYNKNVLLRYVFLSAEAVSAEVRRTTPAQRTQHSARFFHLKRWFPKLSQTTKSPHELYSTTVGFPTNILHTLGSHYRGQFVHGSRCVIAQRALELAK